MSGEYILIIDDSRQIVKHLADHVLRPYGYQTQFALDGQTGLALIEESHPDLIMLDFNLPEMTGIDVLQHMAQKTITTPVILMTAYGSELSAIEAFRLGAKDYLIKPFTSDEVLEAIDRALVEKRLLHDNEELAEQLRRAKVEMSRQNQQMSTLAHIGKAIASLLSVDKVLERVLEAATYLTNAQQSSIWLPVEGGSQLKVYEREEPVPHKVKNEPLLMEKLPAADAQAGQVLQTGQSLRRSQFTGPGIRVKANHYVRAILHVPLKLRGVTMGVLSVCNTTALRSFSKQDEFLLSFLADYAAIALENARVFQAADQALAAGLDELNMLIEITRTITASLELDEIIRLTIKLVHENWQIEAASLWLLDEERQVLRVLANSGTSEQVLKEIDVPYGEGFVGYVASTGKWAYTNDAATHPQHYRQVDDQTGFETRSLLCVPLTFREKVVGVMQLLNKLDGDFDDWDVERALAIATAVAIAVTNAHLFKKTEANKRYQDEFVATISHDMRAPLTTITSFAADLHHVGPLNEEQQLYVQHILRASERMMEMVNGLLDLAGISTARLEDSYELCDLRKIARDVVTALRDQAARRQISLCLTTAEQACLVNGEPAQLYSAVNNLVDNAIKYSPDGQTVQVTVQTDHRYVQVDVCDQGEGISAQELPYIFDRFYRGRAGDGRIGIGLGLAVVKSVALAHGGIVWAENNPDAGSTFSMRLPAVRHYA